MNAKRKRVVVTGLGVLSAIGKNRAEFAESLLAGVGGIKSSEMYNRYFENCYASELVDDYDYAAHIAPDVLEGLDLVALWSYRVGREALEDSGLFGNAEYLREAGAMIGVSSAGTEAFLPVLLNNDDAVSDAKVRVAGSYSSAGPGVAALFGLGGGYEVIATACTASPNGIGLAFDAIQNDKNKIVLSVGAEPLYMPTFAGFKVLDAMSDGPCSPFSGTPGMSVGEGAGAIVLEEYEHARARGATIYAEILGYATSCDAYHETSPDPKGDGAALVMSFALRNAGLEARSIEYVNAHGTGTEANDKAESAAIRKVFAERTDVPVSSTKSFIGHNISSAGIMELIACMVTLPKKKIPATLNFTEARPYVGDLNVVANTPGDGSVNLFMKNNYAFGGNNCCIIAALEPESVPTPPATARRVVITGLGSLTSLGIGADAFFAGIEAGRSPSQEVDLQVIARADAAADGEQSPVFWMSRNPGVRKILERLPLDAGGRLRLRTHQVEEFSPRKHLRTVDVRKLQPVSIFALVAFQQALKDAGLKISKANREELGMILGLSRGPQTAIDNYFSSLSPDPANARISEFSKALYNSVASQCSITQGVRGYNTTLATGYSSALGAIAQAYEVVRTGMQNYMIAGAADESAYGFSLMIHAQNNFLNYGLADQDFRVYGEDSRGFHIGEGAGLFLLETPESAVARDARIYGEVLGYGRACETTLLFSKHAPVGDGPGVSGSQAMARAIRAALTEADLAPEDLDLIVGSSWGTAEADRRELEGIAEALGDAAAGIPLTNLNGYFGFVEAAGAGLNLMGALRSMHSGTIAPIAFAPTIHGEFAGRFDFVLAESRRAQKIRRALVTGASEGGNCYAVIVGAGDSV
ncbi:MAG: beta-ketoacyl-[acyl-carrier-protein] synthase family protein [bacterium]|nr:beta-ketoacyl-[acyl-carrier-protein] synthase family protein [bacterium]